jgi:hypothetical protein
MSPNENTIYHLYNDGTIVSTKGGEVYGQRSFIDTAPAVIPRYFADKFKFNKFTTVGLEMRIESYSILTRDECLAIREEMRQCYLQSVEEVPQCYSHSIEKPTS